MDRFNFTDVTFQSNSASAGGAVAEYAAGGDVLNPTTFSKCVFSENVASGDGGAVDILSGYQEFVSCDFEGNSAGEENTDHIWGAGFREE